MNVIEMPSKRNSQPPKSYDEPKQLWSEESAAGNENSSTSSDSEDDSGSECEMSELCRINQEIWDESTIWADLHVSIIHCRKEFVRSIQVLKSKENY